MTHSLEPKKPAQVFSLKTAKDRAEAEKDFIPRRAQELLPLIVNARKHLQAGMGKVDGLVRSQYIEQMLWFERALSDIGTLLEENKLKTARAVIKTAEDFLKRI